MHLVLIVGFARSGTTLIGNLLAELPGVAHVGELDTYWQRTWDRGAGRRCGCSELVAECALWRSVRARTSPDTDVESLAGAEGRELRLVELRSAEPPSRAASTAELGAATSAVRRALAEHLDAQVIVDSSKRSAYAQLAAAHHSGRVSVLHVVRDVRGVVASRQRGAKRRGVRHLRVHMAKDAASWMWDHRRHRWHDVDYMLLRYEDFVEAPTDALSEVVARFGLPDDPADVISSHSAVVGTHHTFWGNRGRFTTGPITISADERWRSDLSSIEQRMITVIAWPLLKRLGYL